MQAQDRLQNFLELGRRVEPATSGDELLGPLKSLPGVWKNQGATEGRGWNAIALPFAPRDPSLPPYRVLVNQYNETLKFLTVDKAVPNRGIDVTGGGVKESDQFVVTLDYTQSIVQIAADDNPRSGLAGKPDLAIHHEPGLFLNMSNLTTNGFDVARLGSVPHGDAHMALGKSAEFDGPPRIGAVNGLPVGVTQDLSDKYLAPYKHFNDTPFKGVVTAPGFPGFDPAHPERLLVGGVPGKVVKTTTLSMSTTNESGGIHNIPFIVKQANAAEMLSTFWIMELDEEGVDGEPKMILQYMQVVLLDFFPRTDGLPGDIRWPHVSINTMEKVAGPQSGEALKAVSIPAV